MSDVVNLARRAKKVEVSPQFSNYSKVVILVDNNTEISVGNDSGRTLQFSNPFGTRPMAEDILAKLQGFQYQPNKITEALLDPAAEIGDAVNVRGTYGGIYSRLRKFTPKMPANTAAPQDEEINHEYQFETPQQREFTRQIDEVRASLLLKADEILAEVVKKEDGNTSSFGWQLNSSSWKVYANGSPVLSCDRNGLEVAGTIKAGTKIGSGSGFTISAKAIYNNISSFGGSQSSGVYVGTDGIQLGQGVKMWPSGQAQFTNISANNMTLTGTLNIGGTAITAAALRNGAQSAYNNSSYWSTGAGYGNNWNSAKNGFGYANDIWAKSFHGSETSYFNNISLYSITHYSTGRVFRPVYLTINGVAYYLWGVKA